MMTGEQELKFAVARQMFKMSLSPAKAQSWDVTRKYMLTYWLAEWAEFCHTYKIGVFNEKTK